MLERGGVDQLVKGDRNEAAGAGAVLVVAGGRQNPDEI